MSKKNKNASLFQPVRELLPVPLWVAEAIAYRFIPTPLLLRGAALSGNWQYFRRNRRIRPLRREIRQSFPDMTDAEVESVVKRNLQFEAQIGLVLTWPWRHDANLIGSLAVDGLEHIETAVRKGNGIILGTTHFGHGRIQKHWLLKHGYTAHTLGIIRTRPEKVTRRSRIRKWLGISGSSDNELATGINVRPIVQALKRNEIVCIAVDGREAVNHVTFPVGGLMLPFATGAAKLAMKTGAEFIPAFTVTAENGMPRTLIKPPIRPDPDSGEEEAVRRAMEQFAVYADQTMKTYPHLAHWKRVREVRRETAANPERPYTLRYLDKQESRAGRHG